MAAVETEICLLWGNLQVQQWWSCMTKAEWAGWAQVLGAVLAIRGASKIAAKQFMNSEIVKEEGASRQLMHFFGQLHLFYEQWGEVEKSIDKRKLSEITLVNVRSVLQETLSIARGISLENLSAEWSTVCIFSRATTVQIVVAIEQMEKLGLEYNDKKSVTLKDFGSTEAYFLYFETAGNDYYSGICALNGQIVALKKDIDTQRGIMFSNMDKRSRFFSPSSMKKHFSMNSLD